MSRERRALIIGVGVSCPAGTGKARCWEGLLAGRSFAEVVEWPELGVRSLGCRVTDDAIADRLTGAEQRRYDRIAHLSILAADEAMADAGFGDAGADGFDDAVPGVVLGLVAGIGFGGIGFLGKQYDVLRQEGWRRVSPFSITAVMPSGVAAALAIRYGIFGPVSTVSSACASGTQAVGDAYRLLVSGAVDLVLTGGAEAPIDPIPIAAFLRMDAMSHRLGDPGGASRPFDVDRDGFVIGEGAAFFVLATEAVAEALGARVYGEVLGYGTTTDAHHLTAPDIEGDGATRCLDGALREASLTLGDLAHVNAHGTSTRLNDLAEAAALQRCAGGTPMPPVVAMKGAIGHLMGGAGAVELAGSLLATIHGVLPPTVNHVTADEGIELNVSNEARPLKPGPFLSASFGFGGQNAAVVVSPPPS